MRPLRFEQAVYGSFPFWDRGYALLAHSPGCRPAHLQAFETICRSYGEPHGGLTAPALFTHRLPWGPWLIVGVFPQGNDDRGRPGALAFHALFLSDRTFRKVGFNPFALTPALHADWKPADTSLPTGFWTPPPLPDPDVDPDTISAYVAALARGEKVAIVSTDPIDPIARAVWTALPPRLRRRRRLATWVYRSDLPFDLTGTPRLTPSDIALSPVVAPPQAHRRAWPGLPTLSRPQIIGATLGFAGVGLALALPLFLATRPRPANSPVESVSATPAAELAPPSRHPDHTLTPAQEALLAASLNDLSERFGQSQIRDTASRESPSQLMSRLARSIRYPGPWLSLDELERLRRDTDPAAAKALAWHAHLNHFRDDRPLPPDFEARSLPDQLAALAWSFRVPLPEDLAPAEVPFALADALAVPGPVRPNPLETRYPRLADYQAFLAHLPRR